jgi:hypothetical protein
MRDRGESKTEANQRQKRIRDTDKDLGATFKVADDEM